MEYINSLITVYRKEIWQKFCEAIEKYGLIEDGDRILVGISGGKDSLILTKLLEEYRRHSGISFEYIPVLIDGGFDKKSVERVKKCCETIGIDLMIRESDIFEVVRKEKKNSPCFLCGRMRRGVLYKTCTELGCNKLALGHHFDDVIETTVMSMLYSGEIKTMLPKLQSEHFDVELIRPLYLIEEKSIIKWKERHNIDAIRCECPLSELQNEGKEAKRFLVKKYLSEADRKIRANIFRSMENVDLKYVLGVKNEKQD